MEKAINELHNDINATSPDTQSEIKNYIKKLKSKSLYFYDIPSEYRLCPAIVSTERAIGIRKSIRKGFDVINNSFFVEEIILYKKWNESIAEKTITTLFSDFNSYYEFLQGDIYECACYYKYDFSQDELIKYTIDKSKINFNSLIDNDIDSFTLDFSPTDEEQYSEAKQLNNTLKKLVKKVNNCATYEEFKQILKEFDNFYKKNILYFLIYNFIYSNNKNIFEIITQYLNEHDIFEFEKVLCLIFNPHEVLFSYDNSKFYSHATAKKRKDELKYFIEDLENDNIEFSVDSYFDVNIQYYVWHKVGKIKNYQSENDYFSVQVNIYRYFETFDDLAKFLDNDLSYCDLSKATLPDLNLSKYKIGKQTKLPTKYHNDLTYKITKKYDRFKNCFIVEQTWVDNNDKLIKNYSHSFDYFFDFVHFLKNDLSDADLLFCDGLQNICEFNDLNLTNALLRSNILDKIGVNYEIVCNSVRSFDEIELNEIEAINAYIAIREDLTYEETLKCQKIYYITDLHILHRFNNAKCKSFSDELYTLQKIIDNLLKNVYNCNKNTILIGGDTSSDIDYFELFVKLLRASLDEKKLKINVIFILGNHELWDFAENDARQKSNDSYGDLLNKIIKKYQNIISQNRMFLLQNNLLYKNDSNTFKEISEEELKNLTKSELLSRLKTARLILFGGLGFAGYNEKFNANQKIYLSVINRQQEIEESLKFESLYKKICTTLYDKRIIIFTHMPQKDWCADNTKIKGFVYVSGHTHRNFFYDDGDYRIYSDNQIGYRQNNCRLKHFYLDDDYDVFATYADGIYEITRDEYIDFYIGKNIYMDFTRRFNNLYMLKKNGYYMFILRSASNNLNILNGGALKRLAYKTPDYYYANMDKVIAHIKSPLDKFSAYQKQISEAIKAIGGSGNIHGAIIDIDFSNHIYVNPVDLTITAYYATDIINKIVYKDTVTLLKSKCPSIYTNYLEQLENKSNIILILSKPSDIKSTQLYLDTDIYRASREINKMQKLGSNILSIWIEPETLKLSDND